MSALVRVDGRAVDPDAAAIPVLDRGFLYGDSAFEVLRTYGGRPFELDAHLARLRASCEKLAIPFPSEDLRAEILEALAEVDHAESYVRVIVTRGVTAIGLDPGQVVQPRRVLLVLPLSPQPPSLYAQGVAVVTVSLARALDSTAAAGAKASNYLANILSVAKAREAGAYEAISTGPNGELIEGTTSNLFVVRGGELLTPPAQLGLLSGITRRVVLEVASALGVPARSQLLFPNDLYHADEAFITSTLRELVPVVRADGVAVGSGEPG
ncbi:MAG: aminotransferase class IV, partial [Sandaracinaceae bacterium]|nr:aminotransferase class IV [Sandaracinaceae bacterium]